MKRILSSERSSAAIIGVCAFYVGVRLWGLTDPCLWFDEIFGVHAAEHTWRGLLSFIAQDLIHPPLFYLLLKIWIAIGGESLLWLRLFPVLFSVLALFPFLLVCRELKLKTQTIIIALLLLAVNGALIKYAQEVRMYSLLLFFSLMSIWLFSRYFIKGKSFTALIFVNILLVHTHYFGWLVVGSEVVAILIFQRIKIRQTLLMFALTFASFVPWMIAIYRATTTGSELEQNIGWIERPGITQIVQFVFDLIEPFYFQASNAEPASLYYISIPFLLLIAVVKITYFIHWREADDKQEVYFLAIFIGAPILMAFTASWFLPHSIWGSRHLIIIYPPTLILIAMLLTDISGVILRWIVLITIVFIIASALVLQLARPRAEYVWCSWEKAAETIAQTAPGPTPVYTFEDLSAYHLWFALRRDERFQVFKIDGINGISEDKAYFLPRGFDGVKRIDIGEVAKSPSFIVFRDSQFNKKRRPLLQVFSDIGFEWKPVGSIYARSQKTFIVKVY